MRHEDLPSNFHGFPVRPLFIGKTYEALAMTPLGRRDRPPAREMWADLAAASLREADQREAAQRSDPCPGCDGCGRVHELSAIICATCGGSGRASDKMVQRRDGSIHSTPRS